MRLSLDTGLKVQHGSSAFYGPSSTHEEAAWSDNRSSGTGAFEMFINMRSL